VHAPALAGAPGFAESSRSARTELASRLLERLRGSAAYGLLLAWLVVTFADASALAAARRSAPPAVATADSLYQAGQRGRAMQLLDSLAVAPGTLANPRLLQAILLARGRQKYGSGRTPEADHDLRQSLRLAEGLRDTLGICRSMRWLALVCERQGLTAESRRYYHRLHDWAGRLGERVLQAVGLWGMAFEDQVEGRAAAAREKYESAIAVFREEGDVRNELHAMLSLGDFLWSVGDNLGSRRTNLDLVRLSRMHGMRETEASALNNLAAWEAQVGDPSEAVRLWREAEQLSGQSGSEITRAVVRGNIGWALLQQGLWDDGAALLDSVRAAASAQQDAGNRGWTLTQLAAAREEQGRHAEAARLWHRVLAAADSIPANHVIVAADALAISSGDPAAELAVLRALGERIEAHLSYAMRREWADAQAVLLLRLHRYDEALQIWRRLDQGATALEGFHIAVRATRCARAAGNLDSARVWLTRARARWERDRRIPSDPSWRESRSLSVRSLVPDLVELTLGGPPDGSSGIAAAYDAVQQIKLRTFLERVAGPSAPIQPAEAVARLETVQAEALAPGELLLDAVVGDEQSYVFAVTRDACRLMRLPGADELTDRLARVQELLTDPTELSRPGPDSLGAAMRVNALQALSDQMLGPIGDLIARQRRLIVSADGPLHLLDLGALPPPASASSSARALLETHEIVRIPSATVLLRLRERNTVGAAAEHPPRMLAVPSAADTTGRVLAGSLAEVHALARRYRGFAVYRSAGGTKERSPATEYLRDYDVLHLTGHCTADDRRPWNSRFVIERRDVPEPSIELRASEVLGAKLGAQLCTLASCESAAGPLHTGEGVQGLAGAFLAAGVRTVVATTAPVDDQTSARVVLRFYEELSHGATVGVALRAAQLAIRNDRRTDHPFYWAGWVVIGDPDTRIVLRRRWPGGGALALGGLAVALAMLGAWRYGFRARQRSATKNL
jgi:tetratricopeptide (TPR) repeat protein